LPYSSLKNFLTFLARYDFKKIQNIIGFSIGGSILNDGLSATAFQTIADISVHLSITDPEIATYPLIVNETTEGATSTFGNNLIFFNCNSNNFHFLPVQLKRFTCEIFVEDSRITVPAPVDALSVEVMITTHIMP